MPVGGPAGLLGPLAAVPGRQCEDADPGGGRREGPPHAASEAEQYYQALQLRGVPTALVKVPGASHGGLAARPSQSAAKASAILAWFARYRDGGKPPGAGASTP